MSSKTPSQYTQSLNKLNADYSVILNELTNSFPYAKAYPDLDKYTSQFTRDESNLTKLQADLFLLLENLQNDITNTSDSISRIVKQINKLEVDNGKLMVRLQTLSDLSDGAVGMYNDSNFIYNYKYYENIVFFLIISGLGYTFYKSMAKGNIPN